MTSINYKKVIPPYPFFQTDSFVLKASNFLVVHLTVVSKQPKLRLSLL